jgi:hypothetical protein
VKIFYAWDGRNPLPESRRLAIDATMELYPDAEYACVTRLPFFHSERFKAISWDALGEEMRIFFGFDEIPYPWNSPSVFSDWARFYWLFNVEDGLYLDTDIRMLEYFDFQKSKKLLFSPGNTCLLYRPVGFDMHPILEMMRTRAKIHPGMLHDFAFRFGDIAEPVPARTFKHR